MEPVEWIEVVDVPHFGNDIHIFMHLLVFVFFWLGTVSIFSAVQSDFRDGLHEDCRDDPDENFQNYAERWTIEQSNRLWIQDSCGTCHNLFRRLDNFFG